MENNILNGYCSWCLNKSDMLPVVKEKNETEYYKCSSCGKIGKKCKITKCLNFTRWDTYPLVFKINEEYNELCMAHDGYIGKFENFEINLKELSDFVGSDVFKIIKMRSGKLPPVVTISGFLSEGKKDLDGWGILLKPHYKDNAWFHVDWESENFLKLITPSFKNSIISKVTNILFGTIGAVSLGAIPLFGVGKVIASWDKALSNAKKTGEALAEIMMKCMHSEYVLLGHSLGSRVIFSALCTLGRRVESKKYINITNVYTFGGAVSNNEDEWNFALRNVEDGMINFISEKDLVLKFLYKAGTLFSNQPIGLTSISNSKVKNINLTRLQFGHLDYLSANRKTKILSKLIKSKSPAINRGILSRFIKRIAEWILIIKGKIHFKK